MSTFRWEENPYVPPKRAADEERPADRACPAWLGLKRRRGYVRAVMSFLQAMGWLALLIFVLPALGYLLVLLVSRPRPPMGFAFYYGIFVVAWFLTALPVVALLWVIPPLPRATVATVVVYLVALVTPLASGMAHYPLHIIRCGHLPVVGTTFAAGYTYTAPDSPKYAVTPFDDHFFCSREEASAAGFHELSF